MSRDHATFGGWRADRIPQDPAERQPKATLFVEATQIPEVVEKVALAATGGLTEMSLLPTSITKTVCGPRPT